MVKEVIAAVQSAQSEVAEAVERWNKAQRKALEHRREAERLREVLRTVCLAWREEADERQARGAAKRAGRGGDRGTAWLPGRGGPRAERHPCVLKSQDTTHTSQVDGGQRAGRDPKKNVILFSFFVL